jgi:hypothetical protein
MLSEVSSVSPGRSAIPGQMARVLLPAVLLCAGAAALWISHSWLSAPFITNDGYHYLDAASGIASGGCLCTRVVYFDDQVAQGRMPSPFTHFPPGYPLLIAGLSHFGLAPETAGYVISAVGFLVTILLIWDTALTLCGPPVMICLVTLVWIANTGTLMYASAVLTESLFTAAMMAVVALIVRDVKGNGRHPALLLGIGGFAGATYALRYAGLFLIPPALLYLFWRWRRNKNTLPWALAGYFAACAFTLPIQIRNFAYTGDWRGFSMSAVHNSLGHAVAQTIAATYHVVLGYFILLPLQVWIGLLIFAIPGSCLLAFRAWRRGAWARDIEFLPVALTWVGLIGAAYVAGIIMASMSTIAQELQRYYQPVYPVLLASLAGAASIVQSKRLRLAMAAMALAVFSIQSLSYILRPFQPLHIVMARNLLQEAYPGVPLRDWLLAHVAPEAVITSEEGLALHYLLPRPVISIMEPPDVSNRPTDGAAFYSLMSRYKSRYLLLFPIMRTSQNSFPFLQELISGKLPGWLKLSVRTADVAVFECEGCTR